jgi:chromosome segregation ATPase
MQDVLEYRRVANEANELEQNTRDLESTVSENTRNLDGVKDKSSGLNTEVTGLRDLLDASKRWNEAANRIAEKRMQVNQKKSDLTMSHSDMGGGRDLKTVERELADRMEHKEQFSDQASAQSRSSIWFIEAETNWTFFALLAASDHSTQQGNGELKQSNSSSVDSGTSRLLVLNH